MQYHSVNAHIDTGTVCDKLQLRVQFIHLIHYNSEINVMLQLTDRLKILHVQIMMILYMVTVGKGLGLDKSRAVIFKATCHTRTQLFSIM